MTNQNVSEPGSSSGRSIHWIAASVLAVLALTGGILLGRVAFVDHNEPSPQIVSIEVLDRDLTVGGSLEYLEEPEVYLLTINTMPPPPDGQVFQVWVQTDDLIVRAGLLNPDSRVFSYAAYSGRYETLFITAEPAPFGSEQPTTNPLISADLTELEEQGE
jgi:hypothetical protein